MAFWKSKPLSLGHSDEWKALKMASLKIFADSEWIVLFHEAFVNMECAWYYRDWLVVPFK